MNSLIVILAVSAIGSAATAETAASEHQQKWDVLRDRGAQMNSDGAEAKTRKTTPRENAAREDAKVPKAEDWSSATE